MPEAHLPFAAWTSVPPGSAAAGNWYQAFLLSVVVDPALDVPLDGCPRRDVVGRLGTVVAWGAWVGEEGGTMDTWGSVQGMGCIDALVLLLALLHMGRTAEAGLEEGPLEFVQVCLLILSSFFSLGWEAHMLLLSHSLTSHRHIRCCQCAAISSLCLVLRCYMCGDSLC